MSQRRPSNRIQVSVTLDPEVFEFIERVKETLRTDRGDAIDFCVLASREKVEELLDMIDETRGGGE